FFDKSQSRSRAAQGHGFLTQGNSPGRLGIVSGFPGGVVKRLKKLLQFALMGRGIFKRAADEAKTAKDAILVRGIRVRFRQDGNAVTKAHVLDTVARRGRIGLPAGGVRREVAVEVSLVAIVVGKASSRFGEVPVADRLDQALINRGTSRAIVSDEIAMKASVGGMRINENRRVPALEALHQCTNFRGLKLDEISIEV